MPQALTKLCLTVTSHLLSSLRPTPYLFALRQLAQEFPKKWGKKYILILWQVQTIMKAHKWTHYRDKQIMRNISPKGGLYVIVPAFIIQGRVWRGGQKEVKYQEAQCESVS